MNNLQQNSWIDVVETSYQCIQQQSGKQSIVVNPWQFDTTNLQPYFVRICLDDLTLQTIVE